MGVAHQHLDVPQIASPRTRFMSTLGLGQFHIRCATPRHENLNLIFDQQALSFHYRISYHLYSLFHDNCTPRREA